MTCRENKDYLRGLPCDWPWLPRDDDWVEEPVCDVLAADRSAELNPFHPVQQWTFLAAAIALAMCLSLHFYVLKFRTHKSESLAEMIQRRTVQKLALLLAGTWFLVLSYVDKRGERGILHLLIYCLFVGVSEGCIEAFYFLAATDLIMMVRSMQPREKAALSALERIFLVVNTCTQLVRYICLIIIRPSNSKVGVMHTYSILSCVVLIQVAWMLIGARYLYSSTLVIKYIRGLNIVVKPMPTPAKSEQGTKENQTANAAIDASDTTTSFRGRQWPLKTEEQKLNHAEIAKYQRSLQGLRRSRLFVAVGVVGIFMSCAVFSYKETLRAQCWNWAKPVGGNRNDLTVNVSFLAIFIAGSKPFLEPYVRQASQRTRVGATVVRRS